jgi:hypothetical protein
MTRERPGSLRRRAAGEDGIALVFAIQVMSVMTLMMAAVLASGMSLGATTERDYDSKNSLAAALSGLDVARYRLQQVQPASNMCLTTGAVATGSGGAAAGECPAYSGDLGNGTTYGYYATGALVPGATCAGQTISASTSTSRCVTAYGTSNGVTRRTQALIRSDQVATTLFPMNGILGLSKVEIKQKETWPADIRGAVASNGSFKIEHCPNSLTGITGWRPGPTASADDKCDGDLTSDPPTSTPWSAASPDSFFTGTESVNDNATVFGSASGFDYDTDKRELKDKSNATLIINGSNPRTGSSGIWTFNFCKLEFTHQTQIKLQNGAVARFLIDDEDRTGSGCDHHAELKFTNVAGMNYDSATGVAGNPTQLQFIVYGDGKVDISNQSLFSAALYAPGSKVHINNRLTWVGSILGDEVKVDDGLDFTSADMSSITTGSGSNSPWARTTPGFVECKPVATASTDPESGC